MEKQPIIPTENAIIINWHEPISEEQMYDMYNIDRRFRETEKIVHNNRTTTAKNKNGDMTQTLNHQTKLFLKPKWDSFAPEWTIEALQELLWDHPRPTFPKLEHKETWNLWWLVLTDLHMNLRDVQNNSLTKRIKIINDRIARVMDRLLRFDPEHLIVPNLWDMNNSDVKHLTSSLKTPMQDTVSMRDSYKKLLEWEITMLESLQQYGIPIQYIKLPGNHDESTTALSAIALEFFFKWSDIDIQTAEHRYYKMRGNTLIALSHWDRGDGKRLFQMIVDECISKQKKKVDNMYAYLGHHHKTIIHQEWPLEIKNLQAPAPKSDRCDKNWYDMKQSMSWFIRNKKEWEIVQVKG